MKFIILCGGEGKRCSNYSFPKPLNLIQGRHMIEYIIENIPSNEIYIIYNIFLNNYNFCEILINKFKNKKFHFSCIDYLTRGAVETAYIGIQKFENLENSNIVFIDNDNLNIYNDLKSFDNDFIGYSIDYSNLNYSFIKIYDKNVVNIEEKNKISDNYCCGFYGFKNLYSFTFYAKKIIDNNIKNKNEFYFSQIYKLKIQDNIKIESFYIENTKHIGTYEEIYNNKDLFPKKKLRICFDLDNTLVTNPEIINDYKSVKPIYKNIQLLNNLKKEGNEIIIYTARRMYTHKHNLGKVIKDIASITIETLEKLDIQYDELIFGKPIADLYIDDKALNPYINNVSYFGLFYNNDEFIPNKIENNKFNKIKKENNYILKIGPYSILKGELYYYQNIPENFKNYFTKLIDFNKNEEILELKMDFVSGIPLFYLYKNKVLTKKHIDDLFEILSKFHNYNNESKNLDISLENIKNNYIKKLNNRFNIHDYPFNNAKNVFEKIIGDLESNFSPSISKMIHGDFWFSNIFLTYDDEYKFIDMKGQVDNILTINGDKYYDYGKLFQSIIGYDLVLNEIEIDYYYINDMKEYFLKKCEEINLNINYLKCVTRSLIFGNFPFINNNNINIKQNVWNLIDTI